MSTILPMTSKIEKRGFDENKNIKIIYLGLIPRFDESRQGL